MEKHYQPHDIEKQWYQHWESNDYFKPCDEAKQKYCIMLPPPNVTGSLHMGHGFQLTLMDSLIRYHRMMGKKTLWQAGTDHAGIATQMVVERQLNREGISRHEIGRDAFVKKVWDWKEVADNNIKQQLRRMGSSLHWERACFTLDTHFNEVVLEVFVRLYREGIIHKDKSLVNWDPKLLTAVSDLEVVSKEVKGKLWHIRYPLAEGPGYLTVATTRPETMLGDTAVAVNPQDKRYKKLVGQKIRLPLTEREVPIIADNYVDQAFGSGCVKITPAHDFNDYAIGKRHKLESINIFNPNASLNDNVPEAYRGLDRFEARKKIINDLEDQGLVDKIEEHTINLPYGDRSNVIVEPYLTDQWFVKAESLVHPAIDVVNEGKINFIPDTWKKTYFQWMENIQDWCISRQLWWGHRIPAWYDDEGNIYVDQNEQAVRDYYQLSDDVKLRQDEDVLDTWFSSALWPFATLGWPEKTDEMKDFYPTSVLVTGFDIIFFWVARMIMAGLKFTDTIPFNEVYVTGLIRDSEGHKMSKSKGNVLDPIDLIDGISLEDLVTKRTTGLMQAELAPRIEKSTRAEFPDGIKPHGTDALRFTYSALATTGRDIRFDMKRLEGYHNFCNKLWNASRYVLMNTEDYDVDGDVVLSLADEWIVSELQTVITKCHQYFKQYRFDLLANTLYEFIWNQYCDWYLELSKPILYGDEATTEEKNGTQETLLKVLEASLRLLHPVIPFITEEIWQRLKSRLELTDESIMLRAYPIVVEELMSTEAMEQVEWLKKVISAVRNIRGEMNISPNQNVPLLLTKGTAFDKDLVDEQGDFLIQLAKLDSIDWIANEAKPPLSATALVDNLEILIPLKGLIDIDAEIERLRKAMSKNENEIDRLKKKLNNPDYIDKAPHEVVTADQAKLLKVQDEHKKYGEQLARLREYET